MCAIFLLERLGSEHVGSERLGSEREGAAASRTPHGVEFLPLEGAEALRGLLEHAIFFGLDDPVRKRRMMRNYLRLVAEVGVVRLRFPSGLASLPHVLDALEERLR